jgi:hypothetical protein
VAATGIAPCGSFTPPPAIYRCWAEVNDTRVPVAPEGYCALGCVAAVGYEKPGLDEVVCVHRSLCLEAGVIAEDQTGPLWKDARSGPSSITMACPLSEFRNLREMIVWGGQQWPLSLLFCRGRERRQHLGSGSAAHWGGTVYRLLLQLPLPNLRI